MQCSQVWRETTPQILRNNWRMSKIILAYQSVNFAVDDECEKSRMKEATNELASLISSFNLGSGDIPIEKYVQLAREKIVNAKYDMVELVDLAWGREIHVDLDLK